MDQKVKSKLYKSFPTQSTFIISGATSKQNIYQRAFSIISEYNLQSWILALQNLNFVVLYRVTSFQCFTFKKNG